jgi:hydrogenase maturation protease
MARAGTATGTPHILIIGVGNAYRSDDAAGLVVAQRLREKVGDGIAVYEESGDGTMLLESWKEADAVMLIDATHSGAVPGTLHRFEVHARPLPATLFCHSTHAFGVAEAIELARALNQLPSRFVVYGIEGKTFTAGVGLSAETESAVEDAVHQICQELALW